MNRKMVWGAVGVILLGLIVFFAVGRGESEPPVSMAEYQAGISQVNQRVDNVSARLDTVETGLAGINTSLNEIKGLIAAGDNKTAKQKETVKVEVVQPVPVVQSPPAQVVEVNVNIIQAQPQSQPKPKILVERSGYYKFTIVPNVEVLVDGRPIASGMVYLTSGLHEYWYEPDVQVSITITDP